MTNFSNSNNLSTLGIPGKVPNTSITNDACTERTLDQGGRNVLASFAVFMGVLLIIENILLIIVIARARSLQNNTNMLVASLAVTDVMVGAQLCLMGLSEQPVGLRSWLDLSSEQIRTFDSFVTGLNFSLVTVSMCHLSALALDRYLYVAWPLHYHLRVTRRRVVTTAGIFWTLGFFYCSFAVVVFRSPKYHTDCLIWKAPAEYGTWPLTVVYVLSMGTVFASTIGIAKIALRLKRRKQRKLLALNAKLCYPSVRCNTVKNGNSQKRSPEQVFQPPENAHDCQKASSSIFTSNNSDMLGRKGSEHCKKFFENGMLSNRNENRNAETVFQSETNRSEMNLLAFNVQTEEFSSVAPENRIKSNQILKMSDNRKTKHENNEVGSVKGTNPDITKCTLKGRTSVDETNISELRPCAIKKIPLTVKERHSPIQGEEQGVRINNEAKDMRLSAQENMKIIKFVLVMCGCFLLCTFMPLVSFLIKTIDPTIQFPEKLTPSMFIMLASNSGMNFFIITFMNKEFRSALLQIVNHWRALCQRESL